MGRACGALCFAANTIQGCFFTLEGVGKKLRPEFRNREVEATSSVDCKMSCIRRGDACKAVSFDEAARLCFHSQLGTAAAPFDLLAQVDLNFDTYLKGECVFESQGPRCLLALPSRAPSIQASRFGGGGASTIETDQSGRIGPEATATSFTRVQPRRTRTPAPTPPLRPRTRRVLKTSEDGSDFGRTHP